MLNDELRELYQDVILDHQRCPRNFGALPDATHRAEGFNPLCGDRILLSLEFDGERIRRVMFTGAGCAISTASASLLTDALVGNTLEEAQELSRRFRALVTGQTPSPTDSAKDLPALDKLRPLAGVRQFPVRVKCATLPWHTLESAINGQAEAPVSTE